MVISSLTHTSQQGTNAVKKLRERKLKSGLPFMINAKELATDQCYLEYPGGSIKLIKVVHTSRQMDVIKVLTAAEADKIRNRFHFSRL